jgi:hypothetical protein
VAAEPAVEETARLASDAAAEPAVEETARLASDAAAEPAVEETTSCMSFGHKFKLMFLGGGHGTDQSRRARFERCNVLIAGNHEGVDISGNWDDVVFWEKIYEAMPTVIVIDSGSESWMGQEAVDHLSSYINLTKTILMFSPNPDGSLHKLMGETPLNYNACVFGHVPSFLLIALWYKLPERRPFVSELLSSLSCHLLVNPDEIRDCFAAQAYWEPFATFDDAVAYQLKMIGEMIGDTAAERVQAVMRGKLVRRRLASQMA